MRIFRIPLALVLVFFRVTSSVPSGTNSTDVGQKDVSGQYQDCRQIPMELGLVVDSANSLKRSQFSRTLQFLQALSEDFDIGPTKTRVSLIQYGFQIVRERGFPLDMHTSNWDVKKAIGHTAQSIGEYNATGKGIDYLRKFQLNSCVTRPEVTKVAIIITDRKSHNWQFTMDTAAKARADSINLIVIGVGRPPRLDPKEIHAIVGNDIKRAIIINNFKKLPAHKEHVRTVICDILASAVTTTPTLTNPTGTPTTRPQPTVHSAPTGTTRHSLVNSIEVYFVVNQSVLGPNDTNMVADIMTKVVGSAKLKTGFRFGLVSDVCEPVENHERYSTHFLQVNELLNKKFPSHSDQCKVGTRKNKVAIIFLSSSNQTDSAQVQKYVNTFVKEGVNVYVSDLSGQGVQLCRAQTLAGHSASIVGEELINKLNYMRK